MWFTDLLFLLENNAWRQEKQVSKPLTSASNTLLFF